MIRNLLACLFALTAVLAVEAQTINTVAGNSSWSNIQNVTVDAAGNLFIADAGKHVVYKVDRLGNTATVAGNGTPGYSGDGALATAAQLRTPAAVAVAPDGTFYIAEYDNQRIRKVATNGIITTIAGTGQAGFTGDGGPATAARIYAPLSMIMDGQGNLFFTDIGNYRVRKITPSGIISTVAGTGRCPVKSGDGGPATAADSCPGWLALGPDGSLYFTDDGDRRGFGYARVRKVAPNGVISTVAGTGDAGFSGDGGPATAALFRAVLGVAVDAAGNIYISDSTNARIRKVGVNGIVNTYAGTGTAGATGDGGPAIRAQLNQPLGMTIDAEGNLYVADFANVKIRKISPPALPAISSSDSAIPAFMGKAAFGSNMYIEIYGTNLSTTTRTWAGSDFNGTNAPTSLDGVSVTVNGKPAFVSFVSPLQVNINTPEDTATGPVLLQVSNAMGASNTGTVNRVRLSPTLHTVAQFTFGGKQFVAAQTPDFRTFIGVPGMVQGVAFARARPGDTVIIFALGCGPTNPATQAGVIPAQNSPLALPYEVRIGGVRATVSFAGIIAGSVGLYQFNVVIPEVPAGELPIELIVDGVPNAQNLTIAIGS
jgi:uncharacterized protein (TIGR03437 family)